MPLLSLMTLAFDMFVSSFIDGTPWKDEVGKLSRMSKITKQQIVDFANKYFGDNYAVIYKNKGQDSTIKKMEKPTITPIVMNRDSSSLFLRSIQNSKVTPIEPVFLDFNKDMQKLAAKSNIQVLYKKNPTNDLFTLMYVFDMLHLSGIVMHFLIRSIYSPSLCNALFIVFVYQFQLAKIVQFL